MGELSKLPGLGLKSEQMLFAIGISTKAQLEQIGAIEAFIRLKQHGIQSKNKPSLNMLYALVGALANRDWREIAQHERLALLTALDSAAEAEKWQALSIDENPDKR